MTQWRQEASGTSERSSSHVSKNTSFSYTAQITLLMLIQNDICHRPRRLHSACSLLDVAQTALLSLVQDKFSEAWLQFICQPVNYFKRNKRGRACLCDKRSSFLLSPLSLFWFPLAMTHITLAAQDRARQHRDERQLVPGPRGGDRHEPSPPALLLCLQQLAEPGGRRQPVRQRPVGQLESHGCPKM